MATLRGEVWWGQYLGRKYGHRSGRTVAGALFERQIWPSYGLKYGRRNIWETNMAILRVEVWQGNSWDINLAILRVQAAGFAVETQLCYGHLKVGARYGQIFATGKSWGTLWSNFTQTHTQTSGSFQLKYWIKNTRESKDGQENPAAFNFWTKEIIVMKIQQPFKKITEIIAQYFHHLFVHQIEVKVSGNTHLTYKWVVIRISPSSRMSVIPFTCLAWVHPGILVSILIGWVRGNTLITLSLLLSSFQKKKAQTVEDVHDWYLNP